jgi:hypothetical protein
MKPVIVADGAPPIIWRIATEIGGLIGCGFGVQRSALEFEKNGDVMMLGDITYNRIERALKAGFRFGVEASIAPFWLARVLQFHAKPRALMGWCLSADTYRNVSLNQIVLQQLPEAQTLSSERRYDLNLLITESIVNTIDHGAPPEGVSITPSFGLFMSAHEQGLEISVVQAGDGPKNPNGLLDRLHHGAPGADGERGRGLYLIAEMSRFASFEEEGRCLRFVVARQ